MPGPSNPLTTARQGLLLMALAMAIVPGMDAIAKLLTTSLAPGQIAWSRFAAQTLVLVPVMLLIRRPLRSGCLRLHAARGGLLGLAILLMVWGLVHLPLANAIAIFFIEPLILTLLAALLLGERIGRRRLLAVLVGLMGALIVIRPNWQAFGPASLLPAGTAVCFAGYLLLTRYSAGNDDAMTMQLWAGVFACIALGVVLLIPPLTGGGGAGVLALRWPDATVWGWIALLGAVSALGHVILAEAFRRADASMLAPLQYLEILSAVAFGWLLFGDFPDLLTWLGTALIVAAGLALFLGDEPLPGDGSEPLPQPVRIFRRRRRPG